MLQINRNLFYIIITIFTLYDTTLVFISMIVIIVNGSKEFDISTSKKVDSEKCLTKDVYDSC